MQGTVDLISVPFMSSHRVMKFRLFALNLNEHREGYAKGNGINSDRGTRERLYAVVFCFSLPGVHSFANQSERRIWWDDIKGMVKDRSGI